MDAKKKKSGVVGLILRIVLKVTLTLVTVAIPLLGVWVASSLAVYLDGPIWLAIVVGVLFFPVLPLLWELWSQARRKKKKAGGERILTTFDRLVLRTLTVNVLFLGVLLMAYPKQGFAAISTRGDWMLGSAEGGFVDTVRSGLFSVAEGLSWLYDSASDNPYTEYASDTGVTPAPTPTPTGDASGESPIGESDVRWPLKASVHPVVADMDDGDKESIESVGTYIKQRISDPLERVKALHDFSAKWLAYDAPALADLNNLPSQKAEDVFAARKAVCAGYSRLMQALGKVTGDEIVVVTGHSRASGQDLDGVGHAWNGVKIDDAWYLMDVTWDSGSVEGHSFKPGFTTDYFLTPPAIFGLDHYPDDDSWQLRADPLSHGEFLRQPAMSPRFYRHGMKLVTPKRSQLDTEGGLNLVVDNPNGVWLFASSADKSTGERERCSGEPVNGKRAELNCRIDADGTYQVWLFANSERSGRFHGVGYIEVNNSD